MPFVNNNVATGLPKNAPFQVGRSDADDNPVIEQDIRVPWASDPAGSYVYYECTVEVMLDSGIAVHNRLPQVNRGFDTLSMVDYANPSLDKQIGTGVNLKCLDQYQDIVQRMGHARYWFRLWGQALRVGYQIPIPSLKMVGGVAAIPYDRNPQWAHNSIAPGGNYGGIPLWHAQWSLWYTTAVPPVTQVIPAADPSAHIAGTAPLPTNGLQAPYSASDDNAQTTSTKPVFD